MRTKLLLLKLTLYGLMSVASIIMLSLIFFISPVYNVWARGSSLISVIAFMLLLGATIHTFIKEKHPLIILHRVGAFKKIWNNQQWVLLVAEKKQGNNLQLNLHASNEIDMTSVGNIIKLASNNFGAVDASIAAHNLMKDTNIKPEDN